MLSRATSRPAATSAVICAGLDVAGPRVHTIFACRLIAGGPSQVAVKAHPAAPRPAGPAARKPPYGLYHYADLRQGKSSEDLIHYLSAGYGALPPARWQLPLVAVGEGDHGGVWCETG